MKLYLIIILGFIALSSCDSDVDSIDYYYENLEQFEQLEFFIENNLDEIFSKKKVHIDSINGNAYKFIYLHVNDFEQLKKINFNRRFLDIVVYSNGSFYISFNKSSYFDIVSTNSNFIFIKNGFDILINDFKERIAYDKFEEIKKGVYFSVVKSNAAD